MIMNTEKKLLSKSAQTVQDALARHGVTFTVVELAASTRTAKEAANTIGCEVAQIIKSLVFRTQISKRPILVLVSGVNQVNEYIIEQIAEEKIIKAEPDFVKEITGFAIGGVPPVGHKQTLLTYIDEDLFKFDALWAAAGTPNAVFKLNTRDLIRMTEGTIISVTK
jgi:prolyl-tRNA editing enzyme YbaK/EbsC (Cys-tRNA(Pro) deacylase)